MTQKVLSIALLTLLITTALVAISAQDYNSSRSNNESTDGASDTLNDMVGEASKEAIEVGKRLIALESKGDLDGFVRIDVSVNVSVCKIDPVCGKKSQRDSTLVCECTHL